MGLELLLDRLGIAAGVVQYQSAHMIEALHRYFSNLDTHSRVIEARYSTSGPDG